MSVSDHVVDEIIWEPYWCTNSPNEEQEICYAFPPVATMTAMPESEYEELKDRVRRLLIALAHVSEWELH